MSHGGDVGGESHPERLRTLPGMGSRRKHRQHRQALPEIPRDAARALSRGPADEVTDVHRGVIAPTAAQLMQLDEYQEALSFAKAQADLQPRHGVAMSQVNIGGDGKQGLMLERPVGLTFGQLRLAAKANPVVGMIIKTRIEQVKRFLRRPKFEYEPGFQLTFKDETRKVRPEDQERFTYLREYLMNCGAEFDPRRRRALQRDDLFGFAAKHLRDSLTLDAAPVEYINTRSGLVHGINAVDGARVFLTDPNMGLEGEFSGPGEYNLLTGRTAFGDPRNIIAVYAQDGVPKAHYTHMDLLYPVRNLTSEEEQFGYGLPEVEMILGISAAWLNAFTLNARSISDNSIPKGILTLLGTYTDEDKIKLKNFWLNQMRGVTNRHRLPVMFGEAEQGANVIFTPTGGEVEEQTHARWMTLLHTITCSTYLMNPAEIAFEGYSAEASSLSGSDTEAQLTNGADKGLHTLLTWFGGTLNEVVQTVDPEVAFGWTGLEVTKEDDQAREQTTLTFGEVRERHGLSNEGIAPEVLDAPNSVAGQAYMAVLQNKQQQDMMEKQAQMQAQQPGQGGGQPGADESGNPATGTDGSGGQDPGQDPVEDPTTPADPEHPTGPNGEARFQDRQGGVWQAHNGEDPAEPQPAGRVAKADEGRGARLLDYWPGA